ncbi:helix-hairpin-helix domain-containing protein [Micromonospora sp. NPDC000089]|uniref:helix-hairpin-helix domain-containing protein n=1 Tax=unclassified Micromonospora TaxID=2617518 RepID=UPI0036BC383E
MPSSFGQWLIVILALLAGLAGGWTLRGRQAGTGTPQGPSIMGDDPVVRLSDEEKAAAATVDTPRPVATVDDTPTPAAVVDEPTPDDLAVPPAAASLAATSTSVAVDDSPAHSGPADTEPTADEHRPATPAAEPLDTTAEVGADDDPRDDDRLDDTDRTATSVPVAESTPADSESQPVSVPAARDAEPGTTAADAEVEPAEDIDAPPMSATNSEVEPATVADTEPATTTAVEPAPVEPVGALATHDTEPVPASPTDDASVTADAPTAEEPATGERGDSEVAGTTPVIPAPRAAADDAPVAPVAGPSQVDEDAVTAGAAAAEDRADDFRRIQGVGPKMAAALQEAGIRTYRQLAELDEAALRETIRAAGLRATASLATWPQQAKVLAGASAEADRVLPAPAGSDA